MEPKLKHLEFIQGVVNRLASDSFRLKGWAVVLVAALFVLLVGHGRIELAAIGIVPVLLFWGLDGYFLWQERLFRALYDHVRELEDGEVDFSMNTNAFRAGMETVVDRRDSLNHVDPVLRGSHRGDRDRGIDQQFIWTIPWRVECSTAFTTNLTTGVQPWSATLAASKETDPQLTTAGKRSNEAATPHQEMDCEPDEISFLHGRSRGNKYGNSQVDQPRATRYPTMMRWRFCWS